MFIIKRFASAYIEDEHLELILVHIVVQLAQFRHVLHMELGGGYERRTGSANAEYLPVIVTIGLQYLRRYIGLPRSLFSNPPHRSPCVTLLQERSPDVG